MFSEMENLELVSVYESVCPTTFQYINRFSHAFIFKQNGMSRYYFENEKLILNEKEMLFIPKGSNYRTELLKGCPSYYLALNFNADIKSPKPQKYLIDNIMDFNDICRKLKACQGFTEPSERFSLMSYFYLILAGIGNISEGDKSTAVRSLAPVTEYLNGHIFDVDLKIGELHNLCGISDTYFRKLFIELFGVSPKKYVINKRLSQANSIITSGEFTSIHEVALSVGFDDALYFSKVYKNKYGYPPSKSE